MKVKKIQSINFGTFKSFQWNGAVPEFHDKVNILLGWNGCGKTIISRLLRSYEKGVIETGGRIDGATFTVGFDTGSKKQNELFGYESKIRVFNEDYIKEIIDQTHLKYVVAIGTAEVDFSKKQKELDDAKGELGKLPQCKNEYDDISEKASKHIRTISGIGHIKKDPVVESNGVFNSYFKSSFEKRVDWLTKQIEQEKQLENFIQSEDELKNLLATISNLSEKEREYKILKKWNDWVVEKLGKINKYLKFSPVYEKSVRLSSYPDGGNEEDWIRNGLDLHKLSNESEQLNICLFCGSKIQNRDELLKHFSNDVIELNNALDAMGKSAEDALREIITCETFYASEKTNLETFFTSLQEKIKSKKENKIKEVDSCEFDNLFTNEEVFEVDKTAWTVEIHYVATEYQKYLDKKKIYEDCLKSRVDKNSEIKKIEQELKELKKKAKNVQIPADRINKLLASTFPYKKIELDDSTEEIGYVLKRDGVECILDSLSEGERNFLALAYFLLSINDEEDKLDNDAVIVVDDPVSSLDSDSLFQVYAILAGEIERNNNRQYFVFTHNLDFFGHLLQNYKKSDGKLKDDLVSFYQIGMNGAGSAIKTLDESLKNYRSDYLYAITKLNEIKDSTNLDDAILAANLLRRSIETFLHFKYGHGDLRSKLTQLYAHYKKVKLRNSNPTEKDGIEQEVSQEEKVMYRFINHGSHEFLGLEKYDITVLQGSKQRIENYFNVIKSVDKDHYNTFGI